MGDGTTASEAGAIDWDMHAPPDSPFINNPAMAEGPAIPMSYVRRMEEAQRVYSLHTAQQQKFAYAYRQHAWTLGMQCGWIGVGTWLTLRGYRYADPVQSLASGFTSNRVLCRICTPLVLLGLTIFSVTALQLPSDVRFLLAAKAAWLEEDAQKAAALETRATAFREGTAVMDRLKLQESRAFEAAVAETLKPSN